MLVLMSSKENSWENAPTEDFDSLKFERLGGITLETWRSARDEIIDWLDSSNHQQLHSTLGSVSQMTFDKQTALAILAL